MPSNLARLHHTHYDAEPENDDCNQGGRPHESVPQGKQWPRSLLLLRPPRPRGGGILRPVFAFDVAREHPRAIEAQRRCVALIAQILSPESLYRFLRCSESGAKSLDSKRPRHTGTPGRSANPLSVRVAAASAWARPAFASCAEETKRYDGSSSRKSLRMMRRRFVLSGTTENSWRATSKAPEMSVRIWCGSRDASQTAYCFFAPVWNRRRSLS